MIESICQFWKEFEDISHKYYTVVRRVALFFVVISWCMIEYRRDYSFEN